MPYAKITFGVLFFIAFSIQAQKNELGKVSVNELQEKVCPTDTSAVAALLFTKAKTVYIYEKEGFYLNHIYEFRIKIYKKEGLNWANFKAPYRINYDGIIDDALSFSDAVTYNLVNNEIVKTKLRSEGSFKKNINEYWNEASITLPNVTVGSIIEFKYTMRSENMVKFPLFNFQYSIPVKYAEYKTEVPEFFVYNPIFSGFHKVNSDAKVDFGYQNYADEHNQGLHMSYKQINSTHTAENIPALKEEDFVDNIDNYRLSVDYELEKTRFPEVPEKVYTQTWEDVARVIYKDKSFGQELNLKDYFIQDLKMVLKNNDSTELTKIKAVFKFVQNKMNWNGTYGYLTDKGVEKAYLEKTGNIADINFILIAMLNYAGINANPALTSTIDHGIPIFPNRTVFNYVIATATVDGKIILMDATDKYASVDVLPLRVLNWMGRLIRQDTTSEEIKLIPITPSKNSYNLMVSIDPTGNVKGKLRNQKTDYEALKFRKNNSDLNKENNLERLEANVSGLQIEDYVIENKMTDLSKPVIETYNFTLKSSDDAVLEKIYINPLLFFNVKENPFTQEKRTLPLYFGYPKITKYNVIFEIPEGYAIEFIPKSITVTTPENLAVFSYKILTQGNKIQVSATLENNGAILSSEIYPDFKEYFQKVIDKENEKIILKKI